MLTLYVFMVYAYLYAFMCISSIIFLVWKFALFLILAKESVNIGIIFTFSALLTGSLWGKPTWGVWWVWDARITSMVILLFFYIAYILIWKFISDFDKASKFSSLRLLFFRRL